MKITIMFGIILMIGLASAIYPGECDSFNFSEEGLVNWTVEGNSTSMEGFSFTQNGTEVTYCFSGSFAPDNFTITFHNNYEEIKVVSSSNSGSSGGSSSSGEGSSGRCKTDWICGNWTKTSECKETRECEKMFFPCEPREEKPIVERTTCEVEVINDTVVEEVVEDVEEESNFGPKIILTLLIIGLIVLIVFLTKKKIAINKANKQNNSSYLPLGESEEAKG